jgi:hypothetical protein
MARSSTSSSSEVDEDISPNNVKFETDKAKFSLQSYLFEPTIKKGSSYSMQGLSSMLLSQYDVGRS